MRRILWSRHPPDECEAIEPPVDPNPPREAPTPLDDEIDVPAEPEPDEDPERENHDRDEDPP
jgi:hypothetical protein